MSLDKNNEDEKLFQEMQTFYEQGLYHRVLSWFEAAYPWPNNPSKKAPSKILILAGQAYCQLGRYDSAKDMAMYAINQGDNKALQLFQQIKAILSLSC